MRHFTTTYLLLALLATMIALGSCTQPTAPAQQLPPTAWKNPAVGTQFVLAMNDTNYSNGELTTQSTLDVYQVIDSNLSIGGKHNVNRVQNSNGSFYTVMEPNGDFSIGDSSFDYNTYTSSITWTTYPLTSSKITDPPVDSILDYGYGDTIRERGERTNKGATSITIGGSTFDAVKIGVTASASESGYSGYNIFESGTYYFIPKIGFFGKGDIHLQIMQDGTTQRLTEGFEMTMYGTNLRSQKSQNAPQSFSHINQTFSPKRLLLDHVK